MEEVEQLISKHVIFQKILALQDTKVMDSGSPEHGGGRESSRRVRWLCGGCMPRKDPGWDASHCRAPREHLLSLRALKGEWFWLLPGSSVSP